MTDSHQLIQALCEARAYPHETGTIELIETHISYVLLTGEFAYKIKKPVRLPFVDFSTLELRKRSCDDEVRLNRRLARALYLDVVPIGGTARVPRVGAEPAIEYAVRMHQFVPSQTLDKLLGHGTIEAAAIHQLAAHIAEFHAGLQPTRGRRPEQVALANFESLVAATAPPERERLEAVGAWLRVAVNRLAGEFTERETDGFVRECHGDLHLGNLVWIKGRILPFDCLEFDVALRRIDTLDEVAFLVMDLLAHERADLAFGFLTGYLEASGDYAGVRLLRFYVVHRALVRCYVHRLGATHGKTADADRYLELAEQLLEKSAPVLIITHGLTGSGKTTVTDGLIGSLPAIRVRSDVERKRLHGLQAAERSESGLGTGLYSSKISDETYSALLRAADAALGAGLNTIVDAAFLQRSRRAPFAELARRCGAPLVVLAIQVSQAKLRERVARRHAAGVDASEADVAVLEYQIEHSQAVSGDEPGILIEVDTAGHVDAAELVAEIKRRSAAAAQSR